MGKSEFSGPADLDQDAVAVLCDGDRFKKLAGETSLRGKRLSKNAVEIPARSGGREAPGVFLLKYVGMIEPGEVLS